MMCPQSAIHPKTSQVNRFKEAFGLLLLTCTWPCFVLVWFRRKTDVEWTHEYVELFCLNHYSYTGLRIMQAWSPYACVINTLELAMLSIVCFCGDRVLWFYRPGSSASSPGWVPGCESAWHGSSSISSSNRARRHSAASDSADTGIGTSCSDSVEGKGHPKSHAFDSFTWSKLLIPVPLFSTIDFSMLWVLVRLLSHWA